MKEEKSDSTRKKRSYCQCQTQYPLWDDADRCIMSLPFLRKDGFDLPIRDGIPRTEQSFHIRAQNTFSDGTGIRHRNRIQFV